jgi:hypothetical protein
MRPADRFFRVAATILVFSLIVTILWISAATAAGPFIEDLTLGDLSGPKITAHFRDGVLTGVFLTIMASNGVACPMMSTNMMQAAIESALQAREITPDWTVYRASLYVLARAGCSATGTATVKPNV